MSMVVTEDDRILCIICYEEQFVEHDIKTHKFASLNTELCECETCGVTNK